MSLSPLRTLTPFAKARRVLGPGLSALLVGGWLGACFVGDAAEGLPCEQDADCGIGVSCVADPQVAGIKCCGGSCLVAGNSTGPGTTSTSFGSESSSSTEDSSTTMLELCGNGVFDADQDEDCDASAPESPPCSDDCLLCGNNVLDPGEGCDNSDNPNCGPDCQYLSACGNGLLDEGEVCDVWGLPEGQECDACESWTAFDWSAGDSGGFCGEDSDCSRWQVIPGNGGWGSGVYFHDPDTWAGRSDWPEAVLRSDSISFPALEEGDVVRVTLDHDYTLNFQDNQVDDAYVDHAELSLESVGDGTVRNIEIGNDLISCTGVIGTTGSCGPANPDSYCGPRKPLIRAAGVFESGESDPSYVFEVPEGGMPAGGYRLRFRLRYDCTNFANGTTPNPRPGEDAWTVRQVTVTVAKAIAR